MKLFVGIDVSSEKLDVCFLDSSDTTLKEVQAYVSQKVAGNQVISGFDFIGKNLTRKSLRGANLAGSLLIAANLRHTDLSGANLIGADLRDADIRDANLADCLFLTQIQVNSAKGNAATKLPRWIVRPSYWEK